MRRTLLGFVLAGRYYASLRPALRLNSEYNTKQIQLAVPTEEDMEDVGGLIATLTFFSEKGIDFAKGRKLFLQGDLGAGKTSFSRGFLRAATRIPDLRVTSPTYLLSNTYQAATSPPIEIHHMDLYRLSGSSETELLPLNLPHVFLSCVSLIEWPTRLPATLVPQDRRLDVTLSIVSETSLRIDDESATRIVCIESNDALWSFMIDQLGSEGLLDDLIISET